MRQWSLSKYLKSKVKNVISYINDFKFLALRKIEEKNSDSIMIGHIHTPSIESINDKTYYNTGDFCESCSFIYEDLDGNIIGEFGN
jgi:UDP-2,3-diacylglucosamine pyrophosphatase LpxH